jgi:hypothetical protein
MKKTCYAYKNKNTREFAKIEWVNDMGMSNLFLWAKESIDQASLYDTEELASANFKKCILWCHKPNKEDWELIEVEISYTIYNLV